MADKYIMLNLDDEKIKKVADVISNKTSKNILNLLTEKELSEKDIADQLKIPVNTVEYNLKKLIDVGLVEKTSNFFWSLKGKKIPTYRLSKKDILISTKNRINIWPTVIIMGVITIGLDIYEKFRRVSFSTSNYGSNTLVSEAGAKVASTSVGSLGTINSGVSNLQSIKDILVAPPTDTAMWFLLGWLFVLLMITVWNHRKINSGGFNK